MAKALGMLRQRGWKPRRTILFCNWDGEEYGLIGSTEWVEEHTAILRNQAVVYINVDSAVQGNYSFELKSAPQLLDPFFDSTKKLHDPEDYHKNLFETWQEKFETIKRKNKERRPRADHLGKTSDYLQFYDFIGIPAMDIRYTFNENDFLTSDVPPVYHTKHNNIEWMKKFVDPDMRYHETVAQVITQLVLSFSDSVLLPFDLKEYSRQISNRLGATKSEVEKHKNLSKEIDFSPWEGASDALNNATIAFHKKLESINTSDVMVVRMANDQMMMFDRAFVTFEQGTITRNIFHTDFLDKILHPAIMGNKEALEEMKKTITRYAYHIQMATQILTSPFIRSTTENSTLYSEKKASRTKSKLRRVL